MMEGALSGKTGFTGNAGYCYVGALKRDDRTFVVALLACGWPNNKGYKWSDTKQLMNYGLENFEYHTLEEVSYEEERLQPVLVENGQTEKIGGRAYADVEITKADGKNHEKGKSHEEGKDTPDYGPETEGVLLKKGEKIEVVCQMEDCLQAPVEAGTEVGSIRYLIGSELYRIEYIVTRNTVLRIDFKWCLKQVLKSYAF